MNKAILIGRVGKDPEIKSYMDNNRYATFSLATSEVWKDKATGERKEKTQWHNVTVKNQNLVRLVEQYIKKGSQIAIEGAIEYREWEKDGVKRYATDIVLNQFGGQIALLGGKRDDAPVAGNDYGDYGRGPSQAKPHVDENMDDDLPF